MGLKWTDVNAIAIELAERYPTQDRCRSAFPICTPGCWSWMSSTITRPLWREDPRSDPDGLDRGDGLIPPAAAAVQPAVVCV